MTPERVAVAKSPAVFCASFPAGAEQAARSGEREDEASCCAGACDLHSFPSFDVEHVGELPVFNARVHVSALHTHGERQVNTVRLKSGSNLLICDDALPTRSATCAIKICPSSTTDLPAVSA